MRSLYLAVKVRRFGRSGEVALSGSPERAASRTADAVPSPRGAVPFFLDMFDNVITFLLALDCHFDQGGLSQSRWHRGERLGRGPRSSALFVFFGRRRTALKVLFFDGTGMCVVYKRLDTGAFRIPEPVVTGDAARLINERAFEDLLAGIDLDPVSRRHRVH
jgi:transposase